MTPSLVNVTANGTHINAICLSTEPSLVSYHLNIAYGEHDLVLDKADGQFHFRYDNLEGGGGMSQDIFTLTC